MSVDAQHKTLQTSAGELSYDYLVLACGATTNFFGNQRIAQHAIPMKTLYEAMTLRNTLLTRIEHALLADNDEDRLAYLSVAIVGGGPTGVEIAGALAEMKRYVLPKDYPDVNPEEFNIHLIDASPRLLQAMSEKSSATAAKELAALGVQVHHATKVTDYDGLTLTLGDGQTMQTRTVIWVSGITANSLEGIAVDGLGRGRRILVDEYNALPDYEGIYAIGDQALMLSDPNYPQGHPQLAQAAIQQAKQLSKNLKARLLGLPQTPFRYRDLGTMATIGRNKAVAEIGAAKWGGFTAWVLWLVVHLKSILSVRNKIFVLLNWIWNYLTYDRSLRLILEDHLRQRDETVA